VVEDTLILSAAEM